MITPRYIFQKLRYLLSNQTEGLNNAKQNKSPHKFLIAYSGGLDSHVLLHLMSEIRDLARVEIRAMHVHHGLQKEADAWVEHCKKVCNNLSILNETVYLDLGSTAGESVEALARDGRYNALKNLLQRDEVLLTAHHQDDQAETLLLQMFRGAGVQGLSAMPVITQFGEGLHVRPLLGQSRKELVEYVESKQLVFINDPSNTDERFDRNFLRKTIMPELQGRWSGINKVLTRVAKIQSETKGLLDELAEQDLMLVRSSATNRLSIKKLLQLSEQRQKLVLRHWIKQQGFCVPSSKKLEHILQDVLHAREDAMPVVSWHCSDSSGSEIRRYQDDIYVMPPLPEFDIHQIIAWDISKPLYIPDLAITLQPEVLTDFLQNLNDPVTVRFRTGGEKVHIPKRGGRITLKKLFQESGIPPWHRSRVPLVYSGEELVWVVGLM